MEYNNHSIIQEDVNSLVLLKLHEKLLAKDWLAMKTFYFSYLSVHIYMWRKYKMHVPGGSNQLSK